VEEALCMMSLLGSSRGETLDTLVIIKNKNKNKKEKPTQAHTMTHTTKLTHVGHHRNGLLLAPMVTVWCLAIVD
jgi:hypothetical protein